MKGQQAYGKEVGQVAKNPGPETDEKSLGPIYGRGPERQAPMVTRPSTPRYVHFVYGRASAILRNPDGSLRRATPAELDAMQPAMDEHLRRSFTLVE